MDLGDWLRSLGLERYEAAFRENEITEKVLPSLTAEDLKDLGVSIVGHRRLLLDAIAALRTGTDAKAPSLAPSSTPLSTAPATAASMPDAAAERRQVTVMFCDLVGSTALAASMDPEDLREIISAYQKCAAETVRRFDGFVAKYLGDGVLVYFGYPQAHEDDPERAVHAGLALISALAGLKTRASLQTRIGIATGLVVVGDLIGSGEAQERGIVGETPNLAARLQGIAEPNTVVIAEDTRKLLGNLFELTELGAKELKGIAGSVRTWSVLRPSSVESRFEALHATRLTALVGRHEEMDLLLRRWSKVKTGEGQVVLLSGEAGIGKSRLTAALLERLASEPHTRLRYFCSPQHTDTAFYPIINQMARAAGLEHDDPAAVKLDKLDALLVQTSTSKPDAAFLAELLSLPTDGRYPALDLAPQQRRQKTLEALISQVEVLARSKPVLMIFEDAHWIDPSSLELLGRTVDRIATLRVLLIVTFRPEFEPLWIGRPYVTPLTINRLGHPEIGALIDGLIGNNPLPVSIRQDIIERTDGIPLFIEEMTKAVLEAESEGDARQTAAGIPSSALAVPPSLHASLMARLDRLGPAKEVAQIGATIGREFSHALMAAVAHKPEEELQSALDGLVAARLLFQQGVRPHASYLFKHALVQDAAYGTLLREPRRTLHSRIAETLETQFADIAENQPEILARHCTEAGQIEKAAGLWGRAGRRSLARSALVEAIEQFTKALAQLSTLPATSALRREQINLQVQLTTPLCHVKGYAAPETKAALERARLLIEQTEALGEPLEDPLLLFSLLHGLWATSYVAFDSGALRELAFQFLALAAKKEAKTPLMIGHRIVGVSLASTGDITGGRTHFNQALALYEPAEHRPLASRFGQDTRAAMLGYRARVVWLLGYPEAALKDTNEAINYARELGEAATLMHALGITALTHIHCGDYETASAKGEELIALAGEKNAAFWKACGMITKGCVLTLIREASDAVDKLTSGMTAWRATGATFWEPSHLTYLARAHGQLGQLEHASRCISDALTLVETTKECWYEAEVRRIAGEIALLAPERYTEAERYFERALTVARQQQAKSWELRAAMSMARLWRSQGKVQQARELLAPICSWFTEGFDTRDLKEAKVLLEELGA
jgi:predicted ATPase/class 3 adenylate cyclase